MSIEKGTIKVVWVEENPKEIHSHMFSILEEAVAFGRTKNDFIIFKLLKRKKFEEFSWELVSAGKNKEYLTLVTTYLKHRKKFFYLLQKISRFLK